MICFWVLTPLKLGNYCIMYTMISLILSRFLWPRRAAYSNRTVRFSFCPYALHLQNSWGYFSETLQDSFLLCIVVHCIVIFCLIFFNSYGPFMVNFWVNKIVHALSKTNRWRDFEWNFTACLVLHSFSIFRLSFLHSYGPLMVMFL
jgi:hypothetical protein